jgi:hypothetical protein
MEPIARNRRRSYDGPDHRVYAFEDWPPVHIKRSSDTFGGYPAADSGLNPSSTSALNVAG